jgi:TonB family protein
MQTVEQTQPDLQLLLNWAPDPDEKDRIRKAAIGTGLIHLLLIVTLAFVSAPSAHVVQVPERPKIVTHLADPKPFELTQKAPNKGAISKELAIQTIVPSIPKPSPAPGAQARKFEPPPAPAPTKPPVAAPVVPEPPKIEQAQNTPQIPALQLPPSIQAQPPRPEKPKLTLESVAPAPTGPRGPSASLPVQGNSVQEAVRELSHGGTNGLSGSEVVDLGKGEGLNLPPSAGRPRMDYEFKSDPMGVDFKPYITQVLAAIRRNWISVYPESAKLGTRGQVKLDFAIAKNGVVNKVVYSWYSGSNALDKAALAAISMANPLPPLPADYRGERIVLSFTFSYNMGR